jgi:hypothetical protein
VVVVVVWESGGGSRGEWWWCCGAVVVGSGGGVVVVESGNGGGAVVVVGESSSGGEWQWRWWVCHSQGEPELCHVCRSSDGQMSSHQLLTADLHVVQVPEGVAGGGGYGGIMVRQQGMVRAHILQLLHSAGPRARPRLQQLSSAHCGRTHTRTVIGRWVIGGW